MQFIDLIEVSRLEWWAYDEWKQSIIDRKQKKKGVQVTKEADRKKHNKR
jgi:hypothetical protein